MKNPRNQPPPPSEPASSAAAEPLPASLEALAGEAEQLGQGPAAPASDAAASTAPPKQEIPTVDFLEGMLAPLAALAPSFHHGFAVAPITKAEVRMLAVGWAAVLDHYFPAGVTTWGPWVAALGATTAVLGPRLMIPAPKKPEAPAAAPSA